MIILYPGKIVLSITKLAPTSQHELNWRAPGGETFEAECFLEIFSF